MKISLIVASALVLALLGCTQEQQNKVHREILNWTGTNGVLEIYASDKLVRRFIKIDKMSTAMGTDDGKARPYQGSRASHVIFGVKETPEQNQ